MKKLDKIINETINKFLIKETRNQMVIPFDGNAYKNGFEDFIDYLEGIGKYGVLPPCNDFKNKGNEFGTLFRIEDWKEYSDATLCEVIFYSSRLFLRRFVGTEIDGELEERFDDLECNCDDPELILNVMREICNSINIPFENYIMFIERRINHDPNLWYPFKLNYDENNLINIERTIDLSYLLNKPEKKGELYSNAMGDYDDGLGLCWSWKSGNSESYNGFGGESIVLFGKVNPHDVDWECTQEANLVLPNETEIRLKPNVSVEVDSIMVKNGNMAGKKLPLTKPIIVSSGDHS